MLRCSVIRNTNSERFYYKSHAYRWDSTLKKYDRHWRTFQLLREVLFRMSQDPSETSSQVVLARSYCEQFHCPMTSTRHRKAETRL